MAPWASRLLKRPKLRRQGHNGGIGTQLGMGADAQVTAEKSTVSLLRFCMKQDAPLLPTLFLGTTYYSRNLFLNLRCYTLEKGAHDSRDVRSG